MTRHATKFECQPWTFNLSVADPGRAGAVMMPIPGSNKFFTGIRVVNGFGGENQLTIFCTARQDSKTDILIVESCVDGGSGVKYHHLVKSEEAHAYLVAALDTMWS